MLKRVDTLEDRVNLEYQGVITGINQIQNAIKDLIANGEYEENIWK